MDGYSSAGDVIVKLGARALRGSIQEGWATARRPRDPPMGVALPQARYNRIRAVGEVERPA